MPESAEVVLASNPDQTGTTKSNAAVTSTLGAAEVFQVDWASVDGGVSPTAAKITKVTFDIAKAQGAIGSIALKAEVRRIGANGTVDGSAAGLIQSVNIPAASLATGTPQPYTVTFSAPFDPNAKVAVCVVAPPFAPSCNVLCQAGGTQNPSDMAFCTGLTGGSPAIWNTPQTGKDMVLEVLGTYTTP